MEKHNLADLIIMLLNLRSLLTSLAWPEPTLPTVEITSPPAPYNPNPTLPPPLPVGIPSPPYLPKPPPPTTNPSSSHPPLVGIHPPPPPYVPITSPRTPYNPNMTSCPLQVGIPPSQSPPPQPSPPLPQPSPPPPPQQQPSSPPPSPSSSPPASLQPSPPPPPPTVVYCPVDSMRFSGCVDVLRDLVHLGISKNATDVCCPVFGGLLGFECALCICATIRIKLFDTTIVMPIAIQVMFACGKDPPPQYDCPP